MVVEKLQVELGPWVINLTKIYGDINITNIAAKCQTISITFKLPVIFPIISDITKK